MRFLMKHAIVLCSGGLDSVTTAHYVKKKLRYGKIILLFFDYGQRSCLGERNCVKICAKEIGADFREIKLPFLKELSNSLINKNKKHKSLERKNLSNTKEESANWYVPCRNTVFLSCTLALADSLFLEKKEKYDIFTGFKCEGQEHYPDTTIEYVRAFNELAKVGCDKFKIYAPLIKKDKEDIVLLAGKLGIDTRKTLSCYTGNTHCGTCLACLLRKEGFYWANVKDSTNYKIKI